MRKIHESSIVEVRLSSGEFVQTHMECVDVGDVFRIRKPDGSLHQDDRQNAIWEVTEMPHIPCVANHRRHKIPRGSTNWRWDWQS